MIYLRTLLLDAGALPRDTAATRQLMAWATQTINEAPAEHHQMLRTYTRWVLLRRASRDSSGDISAGAARHVKASLRGLVAFLTWAEEQQTPLRALTQPRSADAHSWVMVSAFRKWPRSRFRVWVWSVRRCARLFHCRFLVVPAGGGWSTRGEGGRAERCGVEGVELVLPGPVGW